MNWRRWHRAVSIVIALALGITFALLPQLVLAMYSQTWYITDTASGSNYVMQRGTTGGGSTAITVANGASVIFVADEAASIAVSFAAGDWTGQIKATPDSSGHTATVEIGSWNGASFISAGTSNTMTFPTKGVVSTQPFTITGASAFSVSQGSWLALRFNNLIGNKTIDVATDGVSYVSSPSSDPGYSSPRESYKELAHTNVWGTVDDPYSSSTGTTTVYMYGEGFIAIHGYHIGYYDDGGTKVLSHGISSGAGGDLSSQYLLTSAPLAAAGTWYAVVFDDDLGSPPETYAECSGADGYVTEDDFEVTQDAIPEFPTVIAAIAVAGLCFGIYYWMRKRRLAYVKA